jgi:hypothetical protein
MRAIEWNDSYDGDSKEIELIRECIHPMAEVDAVNRAIEKAIIDLENLLKNMKGNQHGN